MAPAAAGCAPALVRDRAAAERAPGRRAVGAHAPRGAWLLRSNAVLPWLALALALLAVARPQQGIRQSETETRGVDIVLALDISPSMAAEDFRPMNRLYVAKETARDFIRQRPHDRIGLVAFAATSFTQCPLTLDHDA